MTSGSFGNHQNYAPSLGISSIQTFIFRDIDPGIYDVGPPYPLYQGWVNTITKAIWYLESRTSNNGVVTALWRAVGPIVVAPNPPQSPLTNSPDFAWPIGQTWCDDVDNHYYVMLSNPTPTTGYWVQLVKGGSSGIFDVAVDTFTAPGTNPVVPDGTGLININGAVVAAHSYPVQTISSLPNQFAVSVQLSSATTSGSENVLNAGISSFNSADFTVDSDGFVSAKSSTYTRKVMVDADSGTGTNPVLPAADGTITVNGAVVDANGFPVRTVSILPNEYEVQVQLTSATTSGAKSITNAGISSFNSAQFSVDAATGFVSLSGSGRFNSINIQTFTTSQTYIPTPGMVQCVVQIMAGGGAGGGSSAAPASNNQGSGGGGGEYAVGLFTAAQIGSSQIVTVGLGGLPVSTGTGGTGGTSSLGSLMICIGGTGGSSQIALSYGGIGGTGGGGTISAKYRIPGSIGGISGVMSTPTFLPGGNSYLGYGGNILLITGSDGIAGTGYGAGGSGSFSISSNQQGGAGTSGIVIITEYIST